MKRNYECVIIGSGVAGMTSAIYLKRMNIDVLIIEKATPGGQIVKTAVIENYPGFTSISGSSLASQMYEQVTNLKIPYLYEDVITIKDNGKTKTIITNQNEITCKSIIIARRKNARVKRRMCCREKFTNMEWASNRRYDYSKCRKNNR